MPSVSGQLHSVEQKLLYSAPTFPLPNRLGDVGPYAGGRLALEDAHPWQASKPGWAWRVVYPWLFGKPGGVRQQGTLRTCHVNGWRDGRRPLPTPFVHDRVKPLPPQPVEAGHRCAHRVQQSATIIVVHPRVSAAAATQRGAPFFNVCPRPPPTALHACPPSRRRPPPRGTQPPSRRPRLVLEVPAVRPGPRRGLVPAVGPPPRARPTIGNAGSAVASGPPCFFFPMPQGASGGTGACAWPPVGWLGRIVCFRGMPHRGLVSMGPEHPIEKGPRYSLDADLDEKPAR